MKKQIKKLPLVALICATTYQPYSQAATALNIANPPANYYVTSTNQKAVVVSGACAARLQVKLQATDSAKKSTSVLSTSCSSQSKYKTQINLSTLKDGVISLRAMQVVNRVNVNVYQKLIKNVAVAPAPSPAPAPVPAPVVTTPTPDPFLTQVFSDDSPWNTPIVNSPQLEPKTVEMMALVKDYMAQGGYAPKLGLNYKQWTAPLHFVDSTTALKQSVYFDTASVGYNEGFHDSVDPTGSGEVKNIPLPLTLWPDPKADGHMIVYDTATGTIYEFSRFRWVSGKAYATRVAIFDSQISGLAAAYQGSRWWMNQVRGAGLPFIGGLIRYSEFLSGEIKHAVAFSGPTNRLKKLSTNTWTKELCGPMATRTDGWETGENTILEGARIQLNPNLNLDTLGLSADAKIIAKAMQKYGGFMADNAPAFSIYFENLGPAESYKWEQTGLGDLSKIPLEQFRVLKCNDVKTR